MCGKVLMIFAAPLGTQPMGSSVTLQHMCQHVCVHVHMGNTEAHTLMHLQLHLFLHSPKHKSQVPSRTVSWWTQHLLLSVQPTAM